jgi:hypothetical protein
MCAPPDRALSSSALRWRMSEQATEQGGTYTGGGRCIGLRSSKSPLLGAPRHALALSRHHCRGKHYANRG